MTQPSTTVRPTAPAHLDRIETLLEANDLPSRDVRAKAEHFVVALVGGAVVGAGGIEQHDSDGLLRSLVVAESHRGRGYGTEICDALEDDARNEGVTTLYLLTTTAAEFFRRRGYEEIPRETAPRDIRRTAQFEELCPASATCMTTDLR